MNLVKYQLFKVTSYQAKKIENRNCKRRVKMSSRFTIIILVGQLLFACKSSNNHTQKIDTNFLRLVAVKKN